MFGNVNLYTMNDKQKAKIEKYIDEIKDEGTNFVKYFKAATVIEKLAIVTIVGVVFILGGIIL